MDKLKNSPKKRGKNLILSIGTLITLSLISFSQYFHPQSLIVYNEVISNPDSLCPIPDKVYPSNLKYSKEVIGKILSHEGFRNQSLQKLSGAVQIPTEVYDEWGFIDDHPEHWEIYNELHKYFEKTFPLIHDKLTLEKVYAGLIYTFEGSDPSLKPLVLMLHQDVVPVQKETIKDWTYPPFSGEYDGEFVWGRGASDCKNLLVGLMELVELLLENDFQPKRTIILSFGADEEAIGRSLYLLSRAILDKYGPDSIHLIVDEGGSVELIEDKYFVGINTGEKGYLDAEIELFTPGGHSSVPPDHTSIGIISDLVKEIESTQYEPMLTNMNPTLNYLQCFAEHSKSIDKNLKSDILKSHTDEDANSNVVKWMEHSSPHRKFLIRTSQAIDIIQGGAKSNALPEHVSILVNNRVGIESTVEFTSDKLRDNLLKIAERYDLGLYVESKELRKVTSNGHFNFTYKDPLATAPVTPINDATWNLFVGTLRHLYEDEFYPDLFTKDDDFIVVTPTISTGNTDTKSYWDLTDHIYRFEPSSIKEFDSHAHSVDEKIDIDSHLFVVAFYYEYLLNLESELQ